MPFGIRRFNATSKHDVPVTLSALRITPTMASADFLQFVVTTAELSARPHGISPDSFPIYPLDLRTGVTVAFWTLMPLAILSGQPALYQVPVRRAMDSLLLLLACTSRCKPCKSLSDSSATTLLGTSTQEPGHARHTKETAPA